ncbi:hypothetical protein [Terricaulis silvestris]|uniref:hypothetical protein n=1 Tax=Terricaulis silvestris TaxID=2686094 RepID=UPI00131D5A43|nr:hypothetical protein [Terricaulis silvestris]
MAFAACTAAAANKGAEAQPPAPQSALGDDGEQAARASPISTLSNQHPQALTPPDSSSTEVRANSASADSPEGGKTDLENEPFEIVVIAARLADFTPEQIYDFDSVLSYGVNTTGDALDALAAENGDIDPTFFVNGEPITNRGDIDDYPVEAIERIEALPRGSAARAGGTGSERVYNIVLRPSAVVRSVSASRRSSTQSGWSSAQGEAQGTYIRGPDRVNLSLRISQSDPLLDSDRGLTQPTDSLTATLRGNVLPISSAFEIDPLLSVLAGETVSIAAVPLDIAFPTLSDFVAGANAPSTMEAGRYRTLRSESRGYEVALAGNKQLAPWLSASFQAQLNGQRDESLSGAPRAHFLLPEDVAASPFSNDVVITVSDPTRPLKGRSEYDTASFSTTLTATAGDWRFPFSLRYEDRRSAFEFQRVDAVGNLLVDPASNPFNGSLAAAIPIASEMTESHAIARSVTIGAEGPLVELPAGEIRVRSSVGFGDLTMTSKTSLSAFSSPFAREERSGQVGVTIPILSERRMTGWGDAEFSGELGRIDFGGFGAANHQQASLSWRWGNWLRLAASVVQNEIPPAPDTLSAPIQTNENARVFDPIRAETLDVVSITGGNPDLLPESQRQDRFSLGLAPLARINLQFTVDYSETERRNLTGGLFDANTALASAFSDRFQRDSSGRLIAVDYRPVNFESLRTRDLRTSVGFTLPLNDASQPTNVDEVNASGLRSRPNFQFNISHTRVLDSFLLPRAGAPEINLLNGGAFSMSGGVAPEHAAASVALTDRGSGGRLSLFWRGASALDVGTASAPDRLDFAAYAKVDLALFAETGALFPDVNWLERTRVALTIENLTDASQTVTDQGGETPLSYQRAYRDPIGRSIRLELRRSF